MTSQNDVTVRIPVGRAFAMAGETVIDATLYLPNPMSEDQWAQMHTVLEAMKPVLVRNRTKANADDSDDS